MKDEIKNENTEVNVNELEDVNGGITLREIKQRRPSLVRLPNMPGTGNAGTLQRLPSVHDQNSGTAVPLSNLDELHTI